MKKNALFLIFTLIISLLLVACQSATSSGEKSDKTEEATNLKFAFSTWVGYAPFYIAEEKGIFKKNGLNVELVRMENSADRLSALAADRIQVVASTVDAHVVTDATKFPVVQIFGVDESYGGDGMIANNSIKSFADLKGKTVAVQTDGGASFFWFLYMLNKEKIDIKDIHLQNMSSGDAGAAFVAKKVDAAVTWEPWLTNAKNTDFGHVLASSDQTPGIITDTVATRPDFAKENPKAVKALVKSWHDAIDFYKSNPDEAIKIMAKAMGQTPDEFKESLKGVRYFDKEKNKEYFGTKSSPGPIYDLTKKAAEFWKEQKIIDKDPNIPELIDYSFVK